MPQPCEIVKKQIELQVQHFSVIQHQLNSSYQDASLQQATIFNWLKNNKIKIKGRNANTTTSGTEDTVCSARASSVDNEPKTQEKKKRGRPKRDNKNQFSEASDDAILSSGSTSSTRCQRAAAQAAEQKLVQVHNFMKATKLRRPTDFDERQKRGGKVSSPPAKSRKTYQKQSAGSSQDTDGINDDEDKENNLYSESKTHLKNNNVVEINSVNQTDLSLIRKCTVHIDKLTNSAIKSHLGKSRSLESLIGKSTGAFEHVDFSNHAKPDKMYSLSHATINITNYEFSKNHINKINHKTCSKTVISEKLAKSTEDLFQIDVNCSPVNNSALSEGQFKGFEIEDGTVKCNIPTRNTFIKAVNSDSEVNELQINAVKLDIGNKSVSSPNTGGDTEELEQVEEKKSRTKVLRKKKNADKTNEVGLNENISEAEIHNAMPSKENIQQSIEHDGNRDEKQDFESNSSVKNLKVCKAFANESADDEYESDSLDNEIRSRTKVIKKHNDVPEDECRSRTKTIKTRIQCNELESTSLAVMSKEHLLSEQNKKLTTEATSGSPAATKGAVVKKRVEEFENLNSVVGKNVMETTGMMTRKTAKNKTLASQAAKKTQGNSAQTRTVRNAEVLGSVDKPKAPESFERSRQTPLASQNRITPVVESRFLVINKKLNSATRPVPIENSTALVQKQALEEMEKMKREEERQKRQAKEEIAIKKKEKTLKATSEETRRKREEKLKKVAAAREVAEREKLVLSLKAEKEKEAKVQQMAAEKEKLREEHLKMKQLAKQKALEHEERRRLEEEARLAKLKEQEEEYKRTLCMRERELELKKRNKENEIRLAELEKAKCKDINLCQVESGSNAGGKLQQGIKPLNQQPTDSYDITPAREDRPLLEPKSENDYGIDHANSGDSSEDESQPKKKIPLWAEAKRRYRLVKVTSLLPPEIWPFFMECDASPDINEIFNCNPTTKKRIRTSSAVWNTPPCYSLLTNK